MTSVWKAWGKGVWGWGWGGGRLRNFTGSMKEYVICNVFAEVPTRMMIELQIAELVSYTKSHSVVYSWIDNMIYK